ncbi:hypothetical protein RJT34_21790 [Clitoria ternatea]|uniref:Uncharacterized protein n=1 Tax=Clitoria ternatea TaxID=43366 RepID=A0AAN9IV43_CLITE
MESPISSIYSSFYSPSPNPNHNHVQQPQPFAPTPIFFSLKTKWSILVTQVECIRSLCLLTLQCNPLIYYLNPTSFPLPFRINLQSQNSESVFKVIDGACSVPTRNKFLTATKCRIVRSSEPIDAALQALCGLPQTDEVVHAAQRKTPSMKQFTLPTRITAERPSDL